MGRLPRLRGGSLKSLASKLRVVGTMYEGQLLLWGFGAQKRAGRQGIIITPVDVFSLPR